MTFYFNPDSCIPVICTGLIVLVICTVVNTVLNVVNSILRWEAVIPLRHNPHRERYVR
jgi:hypothetical protein